MKSVQIRNYLWSVFSCIRTEYRKIPTRNNSVFGQFSRSGSYLGKFQGKTAVHCAAKFQYNYCRKKISLKSFSSKCEQIRGYLPISLYFLQKFLKENFVSIANAIEMIFGQICRLGSDVIFSKVLKLSL